MGTIRSPIIYRASPIGIGDLQIEITVEGGVAKELLSPSKAFSTR